MVTQTAGWSAWARMDVHRREAARKDRISVAGRPQVWLHIGLSAYYRHAGRTVPHQGKPTRIP
eukprot:7170816-Prymnesium_polylepis.1